MAKAIGKGSLCLFNVQGNVEKYIQAEAAERLMKKLGMEIPNKKMVQGFDLPVVPKQEDFYLFPFRHLSATIVGGGSYKATDFSVGSVLKKSTNLLVGKPAYKNHIQMVGEAIGHIGETEWVGQYKNSKGEVIPGGIEGPFVIDSVLHPDIVRQMLSPVSPIDSCSVTVVFEWEASHDFEHEGDFFWHLGEDVDGSMVRRNVTEVICYEESSLVWMGADPFAKMLDSKGQVVNIDRAAAYSKHKLSDNNLLNTYDPKARYYLFDCLDSEKLLHLSKSTEHLQKPKPENDTTMNEDLLQFLAAFFATTPENLKTGKFTKADAEKIVTVDGFKTMKTNSEGFTRVSAEKTALDTKVTDLTTQVNNLNTEKTTLSKTIDDNKTKVTLADDVLKRSREEAKRVYGIFAKGKVEKTIEDELEAETSLEKLEAKIKMFGGQAITHFGAVCSDCQSTNIQIRSSQKKDDDIDPKKGKKPSDMVSDIYR